MVMPPRKATPKLPSPAAASFGQFLSCLTIASGVGELATWVIGPPQPTALICVPG